MITLSSLILFGGIVVFIHDFFPKLSDKAGMFIAFFTSIAFGVALHHYFG